MGTQAQMERYVATLVPKAQKNVDIVSAKERGIESAYHISIDNSIRNFTPQVSRRTAGREDRSIPRISTAPTLLGALLGYQAAEFDFNMMRDKKGFRGGWYLYDIPFDFALQPKPNILYDVRRTDEFWLVPYNEEAWQYPAKKVAKFFLSEIRVRYQGNFRILAGTVVVEHKGDKPLRITNETSLEKGKWKFNIPDMSIDQSIKKVTVEDLTELSAKEYRELKKLNADLLSFEEPPSSTW